MSEDKTAPKEIRKSILIIKGQAKSLTLVENFLRNRDWRIQSVTNLKEALTFLVSQKPSFVMISVDHPNKKVRMLPKLLQQSFPVFVMVFAEQSNTGSYKNLLESGCNYRINPPATGPAVERTINKILKDQEEERDRAARIARGEIDPVAPTSESGDSSESGPSRVAGTAPTNGLGSDRISIQGAGPGSFNIQSATDILKQMAEGGDDADAAMVSMSEGTSGGQPAMVNAQALSAMEAALAQGDAGAMPSSRTKQQGPSWVPTEGQNAPGAGPGAELKARTNDAKGDGLGGVIGGSLDGRQGNAIGEGSLKGPQGSAIGEAGEAGTMSARAGGKKSTQAPLPQYDENDFQGAPGMAGPSAADKDAPALQFDQAGKMVARETDHRPGKERESEAPSISQARQDRAAGRASNNWEKDDNVFVRGTQKALDESVLTKNTTSNPTQKVQASSNVACLIIESPRFSGYLVAALGKDRQIDERFVETIKERLVKFLQDNGEPLKEGSALSLKIKQVDFEDWALEYADFLRKSVHDGEEIAMAFFPFSGANAALEESASVDMGSVRLEELKEDVAVDFNLYIYLPANGKYILYTPRGSKFYANQKGRLAGMGVTRMHVKREELQDVSRYRAQNYLNSKIEEFERRRRGTPVAA